MLVSVPLLIAGADGDGRGPDTRPQRAEGVTMPRDGAPTAPSDAYATESASPRASQPGERGPSPAKKPAKEEEEERAGGSPEARPAARPTARSTPEQSDCRGGTGDNQMWDFEVRYRGEGPRATDLFLIRNRKDGYCMDLEGRGAVHSSQPLIENVCIGTTGDNQLWWLESRSGGTWRLHNFAANQWCMDVDGVRSARGNAVLAVVPCLDGDDHEWTLS